MFIDQPILKLQKSKKVFLTARESPSPTPANLELFIIKVLTLYLNFILIIYPNFLFKKVKIIQW